MSVAETPFSLLEDMINVSKYDSESVILKVEKPQKVNI